MPYIYVEYIIRMQILLLLIYIYKKKKKSKTKNDERSKQNHNFSFPFGFYEPILVNQIVFIFFDFCNLSEKMKRRRNFQSIILISVWSTRPKPPILLLLRLFKYLILKLYFLNFIFVIFSKTITINLKNILRVQLKLMR